MPRASEWIEPEVYWASRIARGPNLGPRPVGDGVVERGPDDGDVDSGLAERVGIGHPRQVHERRRTDVGREIEVVERVVLAVPTILARVAGVGLGVVWALSHGGSSEDGRGVDALRSDPSRWGAPPVRTLSSSGTRRGRW